MEGTAHYSLLTTRCSLFALGGVWGETMRIVVHGQQAFGKSVLEALLKRG